MASSNTRQKLLDFLNRKAFDPVLNGSPDHNKSEADKKALEHVQRGTKSEKERYASYESAQKVKEMFEDDLNSEPAKKIQPSLTSSTCPSCRTSKRNSSSSAKERV